jgi:hypothetical protein
VAIHKTMPPAKAQFGIGLVVVNNAATKSRSGKGAQPCLRGDMLGRSSSRLGAVIEPLVVGIFSNIFWQAEASRSQLGARQS